jgi:hypothetical protein
MEKRRHRAWLLIGAMGAVAVTFALVFASCSPNGGNGGEGITLDEAIAIARQAVIDDGIMSLDERDTAHEEESTYWHIYFPHSSSFVRGGEPHVKVAKSDGAILDIRYTQ